MQERGTIPLARLGFKHTAGADLTRVPLDARQGDGFDRAAALIHCPVLGAGLLFFRHPERSRPRGGVVEGSFSVAEHKNRSLHCSLRCAPLAPIGTTEVFSHMR